MVMYARKPTMMILIMSTLLTQGMAVTQDVCTGDDFTATCGPGEVLVMETSEFGRMEPGECLAEDSGDFGCTNDIMALTDAWCSGRQQCQVYVADKEMMEANTQCSKQYLSFFRATFSCLKVTRFEQSCSLDKPVVINSYPGTLSSHVTDDSDCGSKPSSWLLQVRPGQTVDITMLDFTALEGSKSPSLMTCSQVYGFILEKALNINHTICGQKQRETKLYTSKTSSVEILILKDRGFNFLLMYSANGCLEPNPPPHAWYKRTGNKAVIGCESNNKQWQLTCSGNTWRGQVGNCTQFVAATDKKEADFKFELSTIVIVAAIIGGTIVLAVAVVVCGVIYLHKYRHHKEREYGETINLTSKNTTLAVHAQYRPVSGAASERQEDYLQPNAQKELLASRPEEPLIHIWETSLPGAGRADRKSHDLGSCDHTVKSNGCHGDTTGSTGGVIREHTGSVGQGNVIRPNSGSYYSPNTGHKYYVLDREA